MEKFAVPKRNMILVCAGLAVIVLGYAMMAGGGSSDPSVFNPEIFSARRITVAPLLIIIGFAMEVAAIMSKPKKK